MSQRYTVLLQETVVGEFEVMADSPEDAFEKARINYRNNYMVNEPGECQETRIDILDENKNTVINFREI